MSAKHGLAGRRALVTGASSGIGKATALRLGREGASVCVNYYSTVERAAARRVAASIEKAGSRAAASTSSSTLRACTSFFPGPGFGHYCASKGGLKLLMQTAARELAPKRIRVLNVAPAAVDTPINRSVLDDPESLHAVQDEIPWGRLGRPAEVAAAIAWLASEEASYITGTTVVVDGGMSLYPNCV